MSMPSAPPGQIVFSHGNSFPAGTYNVLLRQLEQQGHTVYAIDKYGHDPRYPVSNNWQYMVQQLIDFCAGLPDPQGRPRYLIGHSMGGILSVMAAARVPQLAQAVLMLDSPVFGGWRAGVLRLTKQTSLAQRLSPGATSHRRRQEWPSEDAVLQHFATKPVFASWHPEALRDYIRHGTEPHPSLELPLRRKLAFDRDIETAIYNTLPDNLDRWLRQHPLQIPAAMIGGSRSRELRQIGMHTPRRITQGRIYLLEGGTHLFPLEQPDQTASLVSRALAELLPASAVSR